MKDLMPRKNQFLGISNLINVFFVVNYQSGRNPYNSFVIQQNMTSCIRYLTYLYAGELNANIWPKKIKTNNLEFVIYA